MVAMVWVHIYHVDIYRVMSHPSQKSPTSSLYDVLMLRYGLLCDCMVARVL